MPKFFEVIDYLRFRTLINPAAIACVQQMPISDALGDEVSEEDQHLRIILVNGTIINTGSDWCMDAMIRLLDRIA